MSEKGYEPDIEPRRFNVAEVPQADFGQRGFARCSNPTGANSGLLGLFKILPN
jgi:hypothetical protein